MRGAHLLGLWLLFMPNPVGANALDHLHTTDDIGLNKIPHLGTSHILVIPSRIGQSEFPAAEWRRMQAYYAPEGGPGTFRYYWQTVSGGRYDPVPFLVQPVLYPDRCPIPGRTVESCRITLDDVQLLATGAVRAAFEDLLGRVRDEQGLDLADFDVNSAMEAGPDGYFDGVVLNSDIYQGVAFPLAAFGNEALVEPRPGGGGSPLTCGIVAMVPPDLHEYGHLLGFIDLYNGPTMNGLMADITAGLSAFSRQQIGWGEVVEVTGPRQLALAPVLDGGPVLRFGSPTQYVLLENRGGAEHALIESSLPGLYLYSVDEEAFPFGPLGFLDLAIQDLYYPNADPPYLNVNLPVGCHLGSDTAPCVLDRVGEERALLHASGLDTGFRLTIDEIAADGTITVTLAGGVAAPDDGGAPAPSDGGAPGGPDAGQGAVGDGAVGAPQEDGGEAGAGPLPPTSGAADEGGCALGGRRASAGGDALALLGLLLLVKRRKRRA